MVELLEIGDKIDLLKDVTERAALMALEISEDYFVPLQQATNGNDDLTIRMTVYCNTYRNKLKAEILAGLIDDIIVGLDELTQETYEKVRKISDDQRPEANTPKDNHGDHTEDEIKNTMIDEYLNSINDFVSLIGEKADFIHRMHQLKKAARILAGDHDVEIVEKS